MRSIVCAGAALLLASSAYAADVEAPPLAYDWTGPYIGVHAGYLWGDVDVDEDGNPIVQGGNIDGFVGGALLGFNYQIDPVVIGLEGDFGFADVDGEGRPQQLESESDFSYDLNWNAHIRGRVGLALDRALIFVAGGLAIADLDVDQDEPKQTLGTTYYGFSIGGGIDYALTDEIIIRAEYLHDEYGEEDYDDNDEDYSADLTTDTVRGALIYKFMP